MLAVFFFAWLGWFLAGKYEGERPDIRFIKSPSALGQNSEWSFEALDKKSGLKRIWVTLMKDGKETRLFEKNFIASGIFGGGSVKAEEVHFFFDPEKFNVSDGLATMQVAVSDFSWRRWWHGNRLQIEKQVLVDTQPPGVEIISRVHNVRQGGSGLVIYKLNESCPEHGVMVGENFFPGYSGYFRDGQVKIAFFALSHLQGRNTPLKVRALDAAGNTATSSFPNHIRNKVFRKGRIDVSDPFIDMKMPELLVRQGLEDASPLERFLAVNRDVRQANYEQIKKICEKTDTKMYWQGVFKQMPNSAVQATYADLRAYYYDGKVVDQQHHLGIDLASYAKAAVPAANSGRVCFVGVIGIYGKTVVIDHGFGLFSMYGHLSDILVNENDFVTRGQVMGRTGTTGLAGGDHLHFEMRIHNTPVDPIEWLDGQWIKNNITGKLDAAAGKFVRAE